MGNTTEVKTQATRINDEKRDLSRGKKRSLVRLLILMITVYALLVVIFTTIMTYMNQSTAFNELYEEDLRNVSQSAKDSILLESEEFKNVLEYYKANKEKILIPLDYSGDYHVYFRDMYVAISEKYPGKVLGNDLEYEDLDDETKLLYVKAYYAKFLTLFESRKAIFGIDNIFFIYPTTDNNVVYMIDFARFEQEVDGEKYISLGAEAYEDPQKYPNMWAALTTGEQQEGFDLCDTEYGKDYQYDNPVVIDGEVLGLIIAEAEYNTYYETINNSVLSLSIIILLVMIICTVIVTYIIRRVMVNPLIRLEQFVSKYSENKDAKISNEIRNTIKSENEIGVLSNSFAEMVDSLDAYMDREKQAIAEREKSKAELSVATAIQASVLPNPDGAYSDIDAFKIHASMDPAKEVGGDFYDFFMLDDKHLVLVIADVSGKGVPASLFMMNSKLLIENETAHSLSPKTILEKVNDKLCQNNSAEMFVTVWMAVLDIETGVMTCVNAGHEFPAIRRADGQFELIKDKHGFVVAGMESVKYKEYEVTLQPGDAIFVYTDGVAEATNAENELFGTDRMLEALNQNPSVDVKERITNVRKNIDAFVKEAPQFDDITMLTIDYHGTNN